MTEYIYEITKDSDGVDYYINCGEIVRCRDCKHGILTGEDDGRYCWLHRMEHFEDYYCADGKRKETEDATD